MKSINVLRKPENKMLNQLINRSVIANTSVPPRADNKRDWSEALQIRTREAKAALGPALHIRRVTWHTMILLCAGGEELERQSGGGSTRREVSTLQMGKMAISTQVPGAAHFLLPRRGTPLWLDFPWFLQIFALGGAQWHENNGDGLCGTPLHQPEALLMGPVPAHWFQQKVASGRSRQHSVTGASDSLMRTPASLWPSFLSHHFYSPLTIPQVSAPSVLIMLSNASKYLLRSRNYRNCSGEH